MNEGVALEIASHEQGSDLLPGIAHGPYLCPPDLLLRARKQGPTVLAVAGADAAHVLKSVNWAASFGLVEPILVGDPAAIEKALQREGKGTLFRIVRAETEADAARLAVGLVVSGEAGLLMKGHLHTDVLMRAAVGRTSGLRQPGVRLTHIFVMYWPGAPRPLIITDAALNVAPDHVTTEHIVRHAIVVARAVGIHHPRIAMLSASETVSSSMPSSTAAAAFVTGFRAEAVASGCSIAGPLAFDVAFSKEAAALKGMEHDAVAGRADIMVVPNIETGNTLFKALVYLKHATAVGVVLGASVPIVLTSRADPIEARLASIALAKLLSPSITCPAGDQ
ncbi:bifunctional enoyl-CoA hydratase/phosphate acetyltransferase [Acidiphilium acidophilum]|uniref:bifunctional enoyl-CoA hydratase/phosphate acetyltransferase n=1 Tax=Acidiphilium acidophilum TaxID=76588 RepID=UPI002E8E6DB4|nr:bifunctional enoyl-CoA hydratase/phosphate acetyltransferase [Acidiphilium acidophilum]